MLQGFDLLFEIMKFIRISMLVGLIVDINLITCGSQLKKTYKLQKSLSCLDQTGIIYLTRFTVSSHLYINSCSKTYYLFLILVRPRCIILIAFSAILPDLTLGTREGHDISHLDHRSCEVSLEKFQVFVVLCNQRISRYSIKKLLIRMQKSFPCYQIFVVIVFELGRRLVIERRQSVVPSTSGALVL